jgi:hypothetical protein
VNEGCCGEVSRYSKGWKKKKVKGLGGKAVGEGEWNLDVVLRPPIMAAAS